MTNLVALRDATNIPVLFIDNGDSTYSEQVSIGGGTVAPPADRLGVSSNSSVGATSAEIIAAGTFDSEVTIQNRHASQVLYISFTSPATTSDFAIQAGAAMTFRFGPTNAMYGIGSGASTTFAAIGA